MLPYILYSLLRNLLQAFLVVFYTAAIAYQLLALWNVARFRERRQALSSYHPSATIMVPVCGAPPHLEACLRSCCQSGRVGTAHLNRVGDVANGERCTPYKAESVRKAFAREIRTLPAKLTKMLTYDQGKAMSSHKRFTMTTGMQIYFAHLGLPWEWSTNKNTNRLIRQYFPKGQYAIIRCRCVRFLRPRRIH